MADDGGLSGDDSASAAPANVDALTGTGAEPSDVATAATAATAAISAATAAPSTATASIATAGAAVSAADVFASVVAVAGASAGAGTGAAEGAGGTGAAEGAAEGATNTPPGDDMSTSPPPAIVTVNIKTLNGPDFELAVGRNELVSELKTKVRERTDVDEVRARDNKHEMTEDITFPLQFD